MAGDSERVRELERELEGARSRLRTSDAKIAAHLARERKFQQRVASAERLCSAALRAAGAARSMQGPLHYAKLNLEYVLGEVTESRDIPDDVRYRLRGCLSEARESIDKMGDIVRGVTEDPAQSEESAVTDDLRGVLLASIRMARALGSSTTRISTEFEELPPVIGHEVRLLEVFFHLLSNAAEAIARDGGPDPHICVSTRKDPDGSVFVTIADSGPGIGVANSNLIFEPFFTTKTPSAGAGLGLPLARELLDRVAGDIRVERREGRGATFTVRLRRALVDGADGAPPASTVRFATSQAPVRRLRRG